MTPKRTPKPRTRPDNDPTDVLDAVLLDPETQEQFSTGDVSDILPHHEEYHE